MARLTAAIKAAPTFGYVWGGVTGYSIKYVWRSSPDQRPERLVLVMDRRLVLVPPSAESMADLPDMDFTVIEFRFDSRGTAEGKTSFLGVVIDESSKTLALEGYDGMPAVLRIDR
jgi:hypothetical protein